VEVVEDITKWFATFLENFLVYLPALLVGAALSPLVKNILFSIFEHQSVPLYLIILIFVSFGASWILLTLTDIITGSSAQSAAVIFGYFVSILIFGLTRVFDIPIILGIIGWFISKIRS
jgi:hypothetical protein